MGNHTLQSTQAFMGPGETPVHGAHGTALSDSAREGQAGNDPAPGSQLSPPPLRCVPAHGCQSGFVCTRVPAGRGREAGSPNSPPCCGLRDPLPSPGYPAVFSRAVNQTEPGRLPPHAAPPRRDRRRPGRSEARLASGGGARGHRGHRAGGARVPERRGPGLPPPRETPLLCPAGGSIICPPATSREPDPTQDYTDITARNAGIIPRGREGKTRVSLAVAALSAGPGKMNYHIKCNGDPKL
ncbi:uncharacterized protein [Chlorocebus sabaeus]|uniref:uncharacterized protein n=1 Tax=Chlorocebus sabaeus TaxID=60711 RepID=UPI003BF9EB4D